VVNSDRFSQRLDDGLSFIRDSKREISIDDLLNGKHDKSFSPFSELQEHYGFSNDPFWIKFSIRNEIPINSNTKIPQKFLLMLNKPSLDLIDFYLVYEDKVESLLLGDKRPFDKRYVKLENYVLPISIYYGETSDVYIRIQTENSFGAPLFLETERSFIENQRDRNIINGLYIGLATGLLLFNCFLWLGTRRSSYGYYSLFIVSVIALNLGSQGLLHVLFPNSFSYHQISLYFHGFLAAAATTLFCIKLLKTRIHQPKAYLLCLCLITLCLIGAILTTILPLALSSILLSVFASISVFVVITVCIKAIIQGNTSAKYLLIAQIFFFAGGLFGIAGDRGFHSWVYLSSYVLQLSSAIELILFSLALGNQINIQRDAKLQAQQDLVEERQAILKKQNKLSETLEKQINKRTLELKKRNDQLQKVNMVNEMTGLYNRRYFNKILPKEYKAAFLVQQNISIIMMDIDKFKPINDNYGHQVGDLCIQATSDIILSSLQRKRDVAIRYGGEEFLVILPDTNLEGAVKLANTIKNKISQHSLKLKNGQYISFTISMGVICETPQNKDAYESMVRLADDLLYRAKENGRDRIEYANATTVLKESVITPFNKKLLNA